MSLPRSKRRKITVDGVEYHWAVIYRDEGLTQALVHLAQKDPGQQLKVSFPGQYTLEPDSVAFMIRYYRERGWEPKQGGTFIPSARSVRKVVQLYSVHVKQRVKASFVEQIHAAMKQQGVTRAELARRLQCSRAHVTQTLKIDTNITTKMLVQLASALGLEVHFTLTPKT